MKYAHSTTVSVASSRAEIEQTLARYGADQFASGFDNEHNLARIQFRVNRKCVAFTLPLPDPRDPAFMTYKRGSSTWSRSETEAKRLHEQACRQRWRALSLCIKAKLEAVECKITTFEQEFLAHMVLPNGQTIGDVLVPQLDKAMLDGKMPTALLGFDG